MQHLISWKQYLQYSALCLFVYYAIIILRFYRNDLLHFKLPSPASKNTSLTVQGSLFKEFKSNTSAKDDQDDQVSTFKEFSDELDALLRQSSIQKSEQSEVANGIVKLTMKYPSLKISSVQQSLLGLIETETKNICKFSLTEEELALMWT